MHQRLYTIVSFSDFNNSYDSKEVLNYYQEQKISSINLSLSYSKDLFLENFKIGFNSIEGLGYQDFIYYSFNIVSTIKLLKSLNINLDYNYYMKWIEDESMYDDNIFRLKLLYKL